jgi:acid phosphatase class B
MRIGTLSSPSQKLATLAIGVVAGAVVAGGSFAMADTSAPKSDKQITNMTDEVANIKAYYGDTVDASGEHWASPSSNYAIQVAGIEAKAEKFLAKSIKHDTTGKKAIVLDVDDTTLATWNYEVFSNWAYNPATNADYVTGQKFPAVPGMVQLVDLAHREGYAIFFLTGRPTSQEPDTLGNLTADGKGVDAQYPTPTDPDGTGPEDGLYTKPAAPKNAETGQLDFSAYPAYLQTACAAEIAANTSCSTIDYKSATRAHIESLGYDIVGNFGDQYSDLTGGHADKTFKLPNPNYYLP